VQDRSSGGCVALQMALACLSATVARVESTKSARIISSRRGPRLPRNLCCTLSARSRCSNGRTHVGEEAPLAVCRRGREEAHPREND
jgi:hypothetical protein